MINWLKKLFKKSFLNVSEMHCNFCGKGWIATYHAVCQSLECPDCGRRIRAPFFLVN